LQLEEIKSKERCIGQLKKDLLLLQHQTNNSKSSLKRGKSIETKTTKPTTNETILTPTPTTSNKTTKKPKTTVLVSNNSTSTNPKATKSTVDDHHSAVKDPAQQNSEVSSKTK